MNVILLERLNNLGDLGDEVSVKPGFARNYLIPQQKAVQANAANREVFEARRAELEKNANDKLGIAQSRAEKLQEHIVTIMTINMTQHPEQRRTISRSTSCFHFLGISIG